MCLLCLWSLCNPVLSVNFITPICNCQLMYLRTSYGTCLIKGEVMSSSFWSYGSRTEMTLKLQWKSSLLPSSIRLWPEASVWLHAYKGILPATETGISRSGEREVDTGFLLLLRMNNWELSLVKSHLCNGTCHRCLNTLLLNHVVSIYHSKYRWLTATNICSLSPCYCYKSITLEFPMLR